MRRPTVNYNKESDVWRRRQGFNVPHWCQTCGKWTQGDAKSVALHESQEGHKARVRRKLDDAAWRRDVQSGAASSGGAVKPAVDETRVPPVVLRPTDCFGQYAVRASVYLEGQWHEDAIVMQSAKLQIAMPDDDDDDGEPGDWVDCRLESTRQVLDQTNEFRSYLHTVVVKTEDGGEHGYEVGPDALRLKAPEPPPEQPAWVAATSSPAAEEDAAAELTAATRAWAAEDAAAAKPVEMYKGVALVDEVSAALTPSTAPAAAAGVGIIRRASVKKPRVTRADDYV